MTLRQERFVAGALGFMAGVALVAALLASGWQANATMYSSNGDVGEALVAIRDAQLDMREWVVYVEPRNE